MRSWVRLALVCAVVLLVGVPMDGQVRRRWRTVAAGVGGGVGGATLSLSDFTYDGACNVPAAGGGTSLEYGNGFAIRYEASDGTNPVHFVGAVFHNGAGNGGVAGWVYEWRECTFTNPGSPFSPGSYGTATKVKDYGNIYGSPSKRWYYADDGSHNYFEGNSGITAYANFFIDDSTFYSGGSDRLYVTYGETYPTAPFGPRDDSPSFMYADLNYAAATATPHGPWIPNQWQFKSHHAGMLAIPASFVTATGLGTKRLATLGTAESSIQASADVSFGPALTAFVPPAGGATEGTTLSGMKLMGYAPSISTQGAGRDRATRPVGFPFTPSGPNPYDSWPGTKWNWNDATYGGSWIHGTLKSAYVSVSRLGTGLSNYIASGLANEETHWFLNFVSESDLASVVAGTKQPYEIQPATERLTWGAFDFNEETAVQVATITSIASSAANQWDDGATYTVSSTASLTVGDLLAVVGTSRPSEYDSIWKVMSITDGTHVVLYDPNGTTSWSGTSATGGVLRANRGYWPNSGIRIWGTTWNPLTCKFYVAYSRPSSGVQMARWSVAAGC